MTLSTRRGFTLIELLLVIGIIAILASIVIVAINPTKQLADARNAQRRSDVNTILNAVYQYAIDTNGNLPSAITGTATEICQSAAGRDCSLNGPAGALDLGTDLVPTYLVNIPVDPQHVETVDGGDDGTDYTIVQTSGRVTVAAPQAEQGQTIDVVR